MEKHFRILGYLFIAFGILDAVSILAIWFRPDILRMIGAQQPSPGGPLMTIAVIVGLAISVIYIVAGWSLLNRKDWARTITIIGSILAIFDLFPLGIALGIYGLWAMFSSRGREDYPAYIRGGTSEQSASG
ncbi:MAG TPA: hypothetical protein PLU88_05230 [Armatimonadota bacterium]|nr:hypothetical protein [Armatimonadota bacterium]HOM71069.1 hypothetical protein [Armatimonadota bacterium]HPP74510.1 hypothetical protein [Armatimonadota bacterium]